MTDEVQKYVSKLGHLKSLRDTTDSYWQQVADLFLPKRDFLTDRTPGTNRMIRVYDSTGIFCTTQLASGLHGMLTPPAAKWFSLKIEDEDTPTFGADWLGSVSERMFSVFTSPASGFASQSYEMYLDIVAFGTGVMFVYFNGDRLIFRARPLRDCWVCENDDGKIDTLYFTAKMTPADMIAQFGEDNVHENVKKAYSKDQKVTFDVLHAVQPRKINFGRGSIKTKKPFESVYIDTTNKKIMKEDGFDDFPYLVPRFSKRSGETYGYGPGMETLSEVRMLNEMQEVMLRAASKAADPPVLAPIDGVVMPMRLDPGGINFYNPDIAKPELMINGFRPDYFENFVKEKQQAVMRQFYIDWMNMPEKSGNPITATEVIQRSQERLRLLSPMLSRMEAEFLGPLIERTFSIMLEKQLIEPAPPELSDREIRIEYTSPIAQAQRSAQSNALLQALGMAVNLSQVDQTVIANINANNILRDSWINTYNIPVGYLNSEEATKSAQDAMKSGAQQAQQAETVETYSKAGKNIASAYGDINAVQ